MGAPQIAMLIWLALGIAGALTMIALPNHQRLTLSPEQQRAGAIAFAATMVGEALLLSLGGFFS